MIRALWYRLFPCKAHNWQTLRHGKVAVSRKCRRCGTVVAVKHRQSKVAITPQLVEAMKRLAVDKSQEPGA